MPCAILIFVTKLNQLYLYGYVGHNDHFSEIKLIVDIQSKTNAVRIEYFEVIIASLIRTSEKMGLDTKKLIDN